MYSPKYYMGDASSILSQILQTGEQIYRDSRLPVIVNSSIPTLPRTPPFYNPATGQYVPTSTLGNYAVPLLIGGAVLLLLLTQKRGRA